MKYLFYFTFYIVILVCNCSQTHAKDYSTSITVFGTSEKYEEAKNMALKNACEQAYGVFLSSKSSLLNDDIIGDDLTTISNGIVKSYDVVSKEQYPDGRWGVVLNVNVSIQNLSTFLQSRGESVSFNGGLITFNIKQKFLKEQAELRIISDMFSMLNEIMQKSFDYTLENSLPKSIKDLCNQDKWELTIKINARANSNIDICGDIFVKTFNAVSLGYDEIKDYQSMNMKTYGFVFEYKNSQHNYTLRNYETYDVVNKFFNKWEFYVRRFKLNIELDANINMDNIEKDLKLQLVNLNKGKYDIIGEAWFQKQNLYGGFNKKYHQNTMSFLTAGDYACLFVRKEVVSLQILEKIVGFKVSSIAVNSDTSFTDNSEALTSYSEPDPYDIVQTDQDYNEVVSRILGDLQRRVVYPQSALRKGVEGIVSVKVLIGKDGRPKPGKTIIIKTADELLNNAAITAIMNQVFPPATQCGQPIDIWASIPIVFRLR